MYLSDREIHEALADGSLIVHPKTAVGPTSIDLHLDRVSAAQIWSVSRVEELNRSLGNPPLELRIAKADYGKISKRFLVPPPNQKTAMNDDRVFRRGQQIVVRPLGFVLWQTKETVGTPDENAKFICFIDGKSTRARTGLVVHLTAPTIHAGWSGRVTLEICNLGPLDIVLQEGDVVAQITVAQITSPPSTTMASAGSVTHKQKSVHGQERNSSPRTRRSNASPA